MRLLFILLILVDVPPVPPLRRNVTSASNGLY